jgi:carbamoyl-phosphate synthase large subunit
MSRQRILVVGGGTNQVSLVLEARNRGFEVIVTDMFSNPPCAELADRFFQVDTTDKDATLRVAIQSNISAVITDQSDVAVPTCAFIAESLQLPGIGFETSLRFTNKLVMRSVIKSGLSKLIPDSIFFKNAALLLDFLATSVHDRTFYLIKPINSQGSKGVARLTRGNDTDIIQQAFREARGHGVLLEEFIDGEEFSVEAFVVGGVVFNLAVTRKFHYPSNGCIDIRNTHLGDVGLDLERKLFEANTQIVNHLGLETGSTHAEFKVNETGLYLMEIAARGGGGNISGKIIPYLTGFSPTAALIDFAIGSPVTVSAMNYRDRFSIMRFFDFAPGVVKQIHRKNGHQPGILHFEMNVSNGDVLRAVASSRDRPGYFIVAGNDRDHVLDQERQLLKSVIVEYE